MASSYLNQTDDQVNILDSVARDILICPCHEGAAREFNELPEALQDEVWNDLTGEEAKMKTLGLADTGETSELIEESLHALDIELHKYTTSTRDSAIALAMTKFPDYVNNPRFRLKFLRADRFNATFAAERMIIHFECKLEIWGPDLLGREINLSDFDEDDLHSLNAGFFQVLPELDHGGRRVLFYYKALTGCYRRRENILRTVWYLCNAISEDESVQRLGVVNVVYNNGGFPKGGMDYEKSRRLSRVIRGLPIRFDSFMVCLDDSPWLGVVETFSMIVHKLLRVRIRTVRGSHTECLYKLMALGIPYFSLPVSESSDLLVDVHHSLVKQGRWNAEQPGTIQIQAPQVAIIEDEEMEDP